MSTAVKVQLKPKQYRSDIDPTWCPGCGDFAVTSAICKAYSNLGIDPDNCATVSGIGCSSRLPLWLRTFGFHSCHGRAVPVAVGMKQSKPDMTIVTTIGDGDCFSIGGGHNAHPARKNMDMTLIVMDNNMYALTKNQTSPTSREGYKGSTNPYGNIEDPMNTISLMIAYGATFVAQTYAGSPKHAGEMIEKAIAHKGFSFVNILSPCPTYNKIETFDYYKPRVTNINDDLGHDDAAIKDKAKAIAIAEKVYDHIDNAEGKVLAGLFYQEEKETYEERVAALKKRHNGDENYDCQEMFEAYRVK